MKLLEIKSLVFPEVKVIRFGVYPDNRGYFTETFQFNQIKDLGILGLSGNFVLQANQSYSHRNVLRGLHFQYNPYMGKLVRTLYGHMMDLVLDIRHNSPTFGCALMYDMPVNVSSQELEWIWVPPGFAHGNLYLEETAIEYFCIGNYSPECEIGICPMDKNIDWIFANKELISQDYWIMSNKDRCGIGIEDWRKDKRMSLFEYGVCEKGN